MQLYVKSLNPTKDGYVAAAAAVAEVVVVMEGVVVVVVEVADVVG